MAQNISKQRISTRKDTQHTSKLYNFQKTTSTKKASLFRPTYNF
jgi:hypothetical protein